jgi:septal ring factor EnvC (AmiA/AmiB activator)
MRDVGKGRERFTEQAQHEYALLAKERDSAQAEVAELKAERGKLNSDLRTLAADIRRIPSFDRSLAADIVLQRLDKPDAQSTQSGTQSNAIEPPSGRPGRDRPVTVEELAAVLRSFSKEFGEGTHVIGDGLVWLADELEGKAGK